MPAHAAVWLVLMITLRQLRYFHTLAGTLHFGRAAKLCAVTQPALSMQIRELEDSLGLVLVERRKNGVQLTPDGREVAERAARILLDAEDLENFAGNRAGPLGRSLSIGVIPTIAPYFLPGVLAKLQERFPDLDLTLHEAQTSDLLDELASGMLDVALLALPVGDGQVESMPLFEDRFLLALPADAEAPELLRAQDLGTDSLILLEEGHCLRDQALALCGTVEPRNMSRFGATSLMTILQMVAGGYGRTLIPEMAVSGEITGNSRLKLVRFAEPQPARTIGLAWRKTATRKGQFRHLGALLRTLWESSKKDSPVLPAGARSGTLA